MKVLWICNQCVPQIAEKLHIASSSKEGWLAGLFDALSKKPDRFNLGIAFPYPDNKDFDFDGISAFGFVEDTTRPENYDEAVTERMKQIMNAFRPDVVHVFGTEYAHTLSVARALDCPEKLLIGFQGVCTALAENYLVGVDEEWINSTTLRDILKDDTLPKQKEKFERRAEHEKEAILLAGYTTGRTRLDSKYSDFLNPDAKYLPMNETMRSTFYDGRWNAEKIKKHSIFVSQCDYPIKGFHILIKALELVRRDYPDVTVRVAGNTITGVGGIKKKVLISTYGKYLKELMHKTKTSDCIEFMGYLSAEEVKRELLSCSLFVLPSVMENSPNSLAEAMLLGVPCVASNVGGVSDILSPERDGILYEGNDPGNLATAIRKMFEMVDANDRILSDMLDAATSDARARHDGNRNAETLCSIYETIVQRQERTER